MAMIKKLQEFQDELSNIIQRAYDLGLTKKIVEEFVEETMTSFEPSPKSIVPKKAYIKAPKLYMETPITSIEAEARIKAAASVEASKAAVEATIEAAVEAPKIGVKAAVEAPKIGVKAAVEAPKIGVKAAVEAPKTGVKADDEDWASIEASVEAPKAAVEATTISPTLSLTYCTAAKATQQLKDVLGIKSVVPDITTEPDWMIAARNEFKAAPPVSHEAGKYSYQLYIRSVVDIHETITKLRTQKHSGDNLFEWIHSRTPEAFSKWLVDTTTRAEFRTDELQYTIATIIFAFIRVFVNYSIPSKTARFLKYCASYAITNSRDVKKSCSSFFKLSPGATPTENMLREVAAIQAIQTYILSHIHEILQSNVAEYNIKSIKELPNGFNISFGSAKAHDEFISMIEEEYDVKKYGLL
jgi:hypothetical protein